METMNATCEAGVSSTFVEWAVCARPLPGETESGDLHLVAPLLTGVLIAVVDGLGHGPEAASAARIATASLRERPQDGTAELMRRCHASLQGTRGVVMSIASIDAETNQLTWVGVGNVDAILFRANPDAMPARESLPQRGGVVGFRIPSLRITTLPIARGDMLVVATDGVRSNFCADSPLGWHPQDAADYMLKRHGRGTDDALVLVARYIGALR
jgi:negative regulator of sigma-B (phosphoserine phosphatase)